MLQQNLKNKNITIHSDSQACLAALDKVTINSETVQRCAVALNQLGSQNKLHLRWVKAHIGTQGNETADSLAKKGSTLGVGPVNDIPVPLVNLKNNIKDHFKKKWTKAWKEYKHGRQTKQWFPQPNMQLSKSMLLLDKKQLSRMVQFFTGHNNLMKHRHNRNDELDPTCRLCLEDDESSFHLIAECPALIDLRWNIFHQPTLFNTPNWSLQQVIRFLRESSIDELLDQHG